MSSEKGYLTKKEFKSFYESLQNRLNAVEHVVQTSMIKNALNQHSISRLSFYLSDIKKLYTSKELIDFGKDNELLKNYSEEANLWMECLDTIQKYPTDYEKISKVDKKCQFKLIELNIKRNEILIKRIKEKGFGKEMEEAAQSELERYREMKNKLFKKIDFSKDYSELKDIRSFPKSLDEIEDYLSKNKEEFAKRYQKLPQFPKGIHLELRITNLYSEIYQLCWMGLAGSAIVMMGVLLEAILKEIIYFKEDKEFVEIVGEDHADFGRTINYCKNKKYITERESTMLQNFRDRVRNKYQHHNVKAISEGVYLRGTRVDIKEGDDILKVLKKASDNFKSGNVKYKKYSEKELRVIGDLVKSEIIDKNSAIPLFIQVHEFLIKKAQQYFKKPIKTKK